MAGDEVGVAEATQPGDAHFLGDSHAVEECLVLSDIVGAGQEGELQSILELISLGSSQHNTYTGALMGFGAVEVESPPLLVLSWLEQLRLLPVD